MSLVRLVNVGGLSFVIECGVKNKKNYRSVVIDILNNIKPSAILDTPSGDGWLLNGLNFTVDIDGIDLFEKKT